MNITTILARAEAVAGKKRSDWYRISNVAQRSADVYIFDEIGWLGVDAQTFADDLNQLDVDNIALHVNSPGGSVWDGLAIMNTLRHHKARVTAYVDGIAASAASFIVVGGADEVVMSAHAQMMIHDASGIVLGNADEMRWMADYLDKSSDNIASIYAQKGTDKSVAEWREVMKAETWLSDTEAVECGLADRVDKSSEADTEAKNRFAGVLNAITQNPANTLPPAAPGPITNRKESDMSDTLKAGLRERLGITESDLDEAGILAALDEALAEQATEPPKNELPEGVVSIDRATLDQLRADAAAGRAARDEQTSARRAAIVEDAIADGKIPPSRREHWLTAIAADEEGTTVTLNSLAKGLIPTEPLGSTGGIDESDPGETLYNKIADIFGTKEA